jgi:hypothetical protein
MLLALIRNSNHLDYLTFLPNIELLAFFNPLPSVPPNPFLSPPFLFVLLFKNLLTLQLLPVQAKSCLEVRSKVVRCADFVLLLSLNFSLSKFFKLSDGMVVSIAINTPRLANFCSEICPSSPRTVTTRLACMVLWKSLASHSPR